ncbi:hypothetical protein PAAL109150_07405 [Paenibacillus alkaliterrae]
MTPEGIDLAYELQNKQPESSQCFIAMSFNQEILLPFKEIVMPRIREKRLCLISKMIRSTIF